MRTRLFLRTTEFLWQEGHTVHEPAEKAIGEANQMLGVYQIFAEEFLAIPVDSGKKSESERSPGALTTLPIEAMMQDKKAFQAGTSHFLGQNFAKASNIRYLSWEGTQKYTWPTSWGASTSLVGSGVMTHGDDDGVILPPRIAPSQVVILPVIQKPEHRATILEAADDLATEIRNQLYAGEPVTVEIDKRDVGGGVKNWDWIKRGVPIRLELGPRDLEKGTVAIARRDRSVKEKAFRPVEEVIRSIPEILNEIQTGLYQRAKELRDRHTIKIDSKADFYDFFTPKNAERPEIHCGFALAHWSGHPAIGAQIKENLKVTIRCIPTDPNFKDQNPGECVFSLSPSPRPLPFGKAQ